MSRQTSSRRSRSCTASLRCGTACGGGDGVRRRSFVHTPGTGVASWASRLLLPGTLVGPVVLPACSRSCASGSVLGGSLIWQIFFHIRRTRRACLQSASEGANRDWPFGQTIFRTLDIGVAFSQLVTDRVHLPIPTAQSCQQSHDYHMISGKLIPGLQVGKGHHWIAVVHHWWDLPDRQQLSAPGKRPPSEVPVKEKRNRQFASL